MTVQSSRSVAVFLVLLMSSTAYAQKTDVVTLANGDRITGEVKKLQRGQLEFSTDDAGTLELEWDKLTSLLTNRMVEVVLTDGRRFLGTLGPAPDARSISVETSGGSVLLPALEVTEINPIGKSFWSKLDGSIDVGYSYTRSSGIGQFNLNTDTVFRRPASSIRLSTSFTSTQTEDDQGDDDRGSIEASLLRYPWQKWFVTVLGRVETNESLGLELRSQTGAAAGPVITQGNRGHLAVGGGMVVNREQGVSSEPTVNFEGLFLLTTSFYTYDRPKTNVDITFQYYPSLSDFGRQRVQLDSSFKREIWKDFFATINVYDTFDSNPPEAGADRNDVGIVFALGWTF